MKKPMIGLVALYDEKKESYWMLPGYMAGLLEAGAIPVMMPLTAERDDICRLLDRLDGVLLTGGHDVNPRLYGETPAKECGALCDERDKMETVLLEEALKADKPVFGICRGLQFLNVHLGGSLYQDLPGQRPGQVEHHMEPPYEIPVHEVSIEEGSPLEAIIGQKMLPVNSYHHQGIKELAPGLQAMAYAPDGLVEAVSLPGRSFVMAVQWHPEFSYRTDAASRKLFAAFVKACH